MRNLKARSLSFNLEINCCLTAISLSLAVVFMYAGEAFGDWSHYGGSLKGDRYFTPSSITLDNVNQLSQAWVFRTGDTSDGTGFDGKKTKFQATPVLINDKLVFSTPFNRVIALSPATGEELWAFDPKVSFARSYSEMFTSRGVATWSDPRKHPGHVLSEYFLAR